MRKIIGAVALLVLIGCVSTAQRQAVRDEYNSTIPTGDSKADCDAKWDAAQLWVAQNIPANVQTATPVLIQTAGSVGTYLAARVIRQPRWVQNGETGCSITIWVYCGSPYGICYPDPWGAAIAFNRSVRGVAAPERKAAP